MNARLKAYDDLNRVWIGVDQLLDTMIDYTSQSKYPPYNVEQQDEDTYLVTLAVAGFREDDIDITVEDRELRIEGRLADNEGEKNMLWRGIAARAFHRSFKLAEYVEVADAALADGLLTIRLVREVPEEKKARQVKINRQLVGDKK
jgi:molecular chaperone IbpA